MADRDEPPPGPALPALTGYLLRRAYAAAASCAQACVSADAELRLVALLAILRERGALSQRQLGDVTAVNRTQMVKAVDALEERGWVVRQRNRDDRRSYSLRLTAAGREALDRLKGQLDDAELTFTRRLDRNECDRLRHHLLTLLDGDDWMRVRVLAGHTGFLIAQAHRLARGWAVEALAPVGLDPRDFGALSVVGRDQPCSQQHLAAELGVTPPAALSMAEQLEAAGWIQRVRNAEDRRHYDLTLTSSGRHRLAAAGAAAAAVQARITARLGADGDAELRQLLAQVVSR